MAEVVFRNMEGMLPELEELENQGVFTKEELKIAVKRRNNFEYKLQKKVKSKEDFLNYIEYELKFDQLRKRRSKNLKIKDNNTAAISIKKRIHTLYRKALLKFGDDLKLWTQYIKYCKDSKGLRATSVAFGKLLQKHCNNPDVWILAAKHEMQEMNNMDSARTILQKGLRQNKESKKLWLELFRTELIHVDKMKERQKVLGIGGLAFKEEDKPEPEDMGQFMSNATAQIVFNNAVKIIKDDVTFRVDFLDILESFEEIEHVEEAIYDSISRDFLDSEDALELISKRPLRALVNAAKIVTDEQWQIVETEVTARFDEAVAKLHTACMWEKYMQCFGELLQKSESAQQTKRRLDQISSIVSRAEKERKMTELMYVAWTEIMSEMAQNEDQILGLVSSALKTHTGSVDLWKKYLLLKAEYSDTWEELQSEFRSSFSSVKEEEDVVLWQMYVDVSKQLEYEQTKAVFEEIVCSKRKNLRNFFLSQYLLFTWEQNGLDGFRKLYKRFLTTRLPLDVVKLCLELEEEKVKEITVPKQKRVAVDHMRKLHEYKVDYFGEESADVWIDYIKFERAYNTTDIERCSTLYNKAKSTLKGTLNAEFISKFTILQDNS